MAKEILNLQPQSVWKYFYDLTQIPRPTFHTGAVSQYLFEEGKRLGLETHRDEVGNVVIRKEAKPGMENKPMITMQAHMDMVPQKNSDTQHDFLTDPIDAYIDGEWVTARGTTLGADNGMGVAMALAVMADNTLENGPLEALFTIDEEVGMGGANALKPGFLKGDLLLNLDSEEEGDLFIGCAGGVDVNVTLHYQEEENTHPSDKGLKVQLSGLKGGHSGVEINLGRGNANKLMARYLKVALNRYGARLAMMEGGNMRNAIPREAQALLSVAADKVEELKKFTAEYQALYRKEFEGIEGSISLTAVEVPAPAKLIPEKVANSLVGALEGCLNGPQSMLQSFPGVVEASTNLSIAVFKEGEASVQFLVRSSSDSRKMWVASSLESAFLNIGAQVQFDASYSGWQPNPKSKAMDLLIHSYEKIYGKKPAALVMHAGLECGIIQGVMPKMDMVSFGPEIRHPHSPDEKVHIQSVERTYKVLVHAIENL